MCVSPEQVILGKCPEGTFCVVNNCHANNTECPSFCNLRPNKGIAYCKYNILQKNYNLHLPTYFAYHALDF